MEKRNCSRGSTLSSFQTPGLRQGYGVAQAWRGMMGLSLVALTAGFVAYSPAVAQSFDAVPPVPAGAVPVPNGGASAPIGQQYVVVVNGTGSGVLDQVRLVEPTAFRTTFQGRSVIQAGRFNLSSNAQQRVSELAALGLTAEMAQVAAAVPTFTPGPGLPSNVYAGTGELPPLPTAALPPMEGGTPSLAQVPALPPVSSTPQMPSAAGNVEFGQQLVPPTTPPANGGATLVPPTTAAPPQPGAGTAARAPYYVIIPTDTANLGTLSSQVVQLGTPADRVQQRTAPRGPHVAVGPFSDRGLANRWNDFYRQSGIPNTRVHFDR
jgi:hypothetical protein